MKLVPQVLQDCSSTAGSCGTLSAFHLTRHRSRRGAAGGGESARRVAPHSLRLVAVTRESPALHQHQLHIMILDRFSAELELLLPPCSES